MCLNFLIHHIIISNTIDQISSGDWMRHADSNAPTRLAATSMAASVVPSSARRTSYEGLDEKPDTTGCSIEIPRWVDRVLHNV